MFGISESIKAAPSSWGQTPKLGQVLLTPRGAVDPRQVRWCLITCVYHSDKVLTSRVVKRIVMWGDLVRSLLINGGGRDGGGGRWWGVAESHLWQNLSEVVSRSATSNRTQNSSIRDVRAVQVACPLRPGGESNTSWSFDKADYTARSSRRFHGGGTLRLRCRLCGISAERRTACPCDHAAAGHARILG